MKKNDVFSAAFTPEYRQKVGNLDINHCFEGTVIVTEKSDGGFILCDTYWGIGDSSGRWFEISEVDTVINIKPYCNLDDIEPINSADQDYYADEDIFRISRQHACSANCVSWIKRKGAERSKTKMKAALEDKAADAIRRIQFATSDYEQYVKRLTELETCTDLNSFYL